MPGQKVNNDVTVKDLRAAIPPHCFKPSYLWSFFYLCRDLVVISSCMYAAYKYIPGIEYALARYTAWALYGYVQGLSMTGLWVREAREKFFHLYTDQRLQAIGHECGHGVFATSNLVNNVFGYVIHSALLTPYFAWRIFAPKALYLR